MSRFSVLRRRIDAFLASEEAARLSLSGLRARLPAVASALKLSAGILAIVVINGGAGGVEREIECVALNIYFEARNEPADGRRAVAHVVLNRMADGRWPDSACAVIKQGWPEDGPLCQFSWYCDEYSDEPRKDRRWRDALTVAKDVYWGWSKDPTEGAYWYHADYVKPHWRKKLRLGPQIGRHIFYLDPHREPAKQSL